jgi:hypothetical protein
MNVAVIKDITYIKPINIAINKDTTKIGASIKGITANTPKDNLEVIVLRRKKTNITDITDITIIKDITGIYSHLLRSL